MRPVEPFGQRDGGVELGTAHIAAQLAGGCLGTVAANVMFELPAVHWSTTNRASAAHAVAELLATFGLLTVIFGVVHSGRAAAVPMAVAGYIGTATGSPRPVPGFDVFKRLVATSRALAVFTVAPHVDGIVV